MYKSIPFLDVILDSSEYYDYELGENVLDYIYVEISVPSIGGYYLLTEDNLILNTEDNFRIRYD